MNKSQHRDPLETQASQELKDPYTRLYDKRNEYQQNKKQREIEVKQKEMESCSFAP